MYDVYEIRKDFPILGELINGKPNIFMDSAASAQKPLPVLEKMRNLYLQAYANVHRGSYYLSETITAENRCHALETTVKAQPQTTRKPELDLTTGIQTAAELAKSSIHQVSKGLKALRRK